jgi:hypothetical protein
VARVALINTLLLRAPFSYLVGSLHCFISHSGLSAYAGLRTYRNLLDVVWVGSFDFCGSGERGTSFDFHEGAETSGISHFHEARTHFFLLRALGAALDVQFLFHLFFLSWFSFYFILASGAEALLFCSPPQSPSLLSYFPFLLFLSRILIFI